MPELNSPQVWRRSSRCDIKDCVELAVDPRRDRVYLRSSRDPQVQLELSADAWRVFCAAIVAGELD
ncbi:MAG: DUF397 domain-containing protein [Micromonosporaceae bacterium]|jgi:hypothetical protein|nr:DUF397 domain-containing protein [Micromonosporaceae bacterium]